MYNLKIFTIMLLKVKAKEKLLKLGTYTGTYRYMMMPEFYSTLCNLVHGILKGKGQFMIVNRPSGLS